jgi:hypothetical protein
MSRKNPKRRKNKNRKLNLVKIVTDGGILFARPSEKLDARFSEGSSSFFNIQAGGVRVGDKLSFVNESIDVGEGSTPLLKDVHPILMKSSRYKIAFDVLYTPVDSNELELGYMPVFQRDLGIHVANSIVGNRQSKLDLQERLFSGFPLFGQEREEVVKVVRASLVSYQRERPFSTTAIVDWLNGSTLAPKEWKSVFGALAVEDGDIFSKYIDPEIDMLGNYRVYVTIRNSVMTYIAKRGLVSGQEINTENKNKNRESLIIADEISLVLNAWEKYRSSKYTTVTVNSVSISKHTSKGHANREVSDKLRKGVLKRKPEEISGTVIRGPEKNKLLLDLYNGAHGAIESYLIRALRKDYSGLDSELFTSRIVLAHLMDDETDGINLVENIEQDPRMGLDELPYEFQGIKQSSLQDFKGVPYYEFFKNRRDVLKYCKNEISKGRFDTVINQPVGTMESLFGVIKRLIHDDGISQVVKRCLPGFVLTEGRIINLQGELYLTTFHLPVIDDIQSVRVARSIGIPLYSEVNVSYGTPGTMVLNF